MSTKSKRQPKGWYSKDLDLEYVFDGDTLTFVDGVTYSIPEALHLSQTGASPQTIRAIHRVKKAFDGEILVPGTNDIGKDRLIPSWSATGNYSAFERRVSTTRVARIAKKAASKPDCVPLDLFAPIVNQVRQ